jgi:hypothetical protein
MFASVVLGGVMREGRTDALLECYEDVRQRLPIPDSYAWSDVVDANQERQEKQEKQERQERQQSQRL